MAQRNKQPRRSGVITGHAGVFWVAAKLSWLGEIVGLSMNNARGIDLTASASDRIGSRVVAVQVKSSRKCYNFWYCKAPPKGSKIIYVFVQPVRGNDELEVYVVPAKDVKVGYGGAKHPLLQGPSGQTYFHLFNRRSSVTRYRNRWDLITGNPQHRPVNTVP